ncbi:MAG: TIGR01777 family protein [Acidimicrobiales bacterium]|nr:MAG: TIGR01777 family protein [Acidimicrobiales bacterium]
MRILVSGSHGLVGAALTAALGRVGHQVTPLVRRSPGEPGNGAASGDTEVSGDNEVGWDIEQGSLDRDALARVRPDAVVHLAGEGLGARRWTETQKAKIRDSRVHGTRLLASALAELNPPPRVMVSASAIGWYGNRGDEMLDESSSPGTGFLAEVCQAWEAATTAAEAAGIRVVHLRSGIVQSPAGGALAKQLPILRLGLGGRLGTGRQYWSWISIEDEVGTIVAALGDERIHGPLNAAAPHPVTNAEYTRVLGRVLGRPALVPAPKAGLSLVLGTEMASEMLLASQRIFPGVLEASGYQWRQPELEPALRALLHK